MYKPSIENCPTQSSQLLVRLKARDVAMFRFLLEGYDNLAFFTVLERRTAVLKIVFSPHSQEQVVEALEAIGNSIPLTWQAWPFDRLSTQ